MKSKEALEYLTSEVFTGGNSILETEAQCCKKIIKQDLERLKVLKNVYDKNIDVANTTNNMLLKENEKLKKAIEILKKVPEVLKFSLSAFTYNEFDKCYEYEIEEFIDDFDIRYYLYILTQQEYDLLKEVLGNA